MAGIPLGYPFSRQLTIAAIGCTGLILVVAGIILARTMNLAACPLCILQRMLYLTLALEALLLVRWANRPGGKAASLLMAVTAGTGAGIAAYQTWLQRFAADASCAVNMPWWERFVIWAGEQAPLLFEATGLCSEAGWKFLSLSIAEWSLLTFSGMCAAALLSLRSRA